MTVPIVRVGSQRVDTIGTYSLPFDLHQRHEPMCYISPWMSHSNCRGPHPLLHKGWASIHLGKIQQELGSACGLFFSLATISCTLARMQISKSRDFIQPDTPSPLCMDKPQLQPLSYKFPPPHMLCGYRDFYQQQYQLTPLRTSETFARCS